MLAGPPAFRPRPLIEVPRMSSTRDLALQASLPVDMTSQLDYILLDGSGSMQDKWWDSLAAIDAYVSTLRTNHVESHLKLNVFDSTTLDHCQRNTSIQDYIPLSQEPATAHWGSTPLYDAINFMGRELRDADPPKCAILIVTDGQESGSQYTDLPQARAILDWCRAKGYQVTFVGCDFENSHQAQALGADASTAIGVAQARLSDATRALAQKRTRYARTGDDISFDE